VETRSYNERNQLTGIVAGTAIQLTYSYSATQNNGQITQMTNGVSGETVVYTYDALSRLATAATVGPEWGLSFSYDGFGNRTGQTATKGAAPPSQALAYDANNRVIGFSYDANGNTVGMPGLTGVSYDGFNRLKTANGDRYWYDAENRRVAKNDRIYVYGANGKMIAAYQAAYVGEALTKTLLERKYYFGGRDVGVFEDRLGTAQYAGARYYPYGEEYNVANERVKYGTYWRDASTGLDYAVNRYYAAGYGRFLTADPFEGSGNPADPQSWNRYAYVGGDPINRNDETGLYYEPESYLMMEDGGFMAIGSAGGWAYWPSIVYDSEGAAVGVASKPSPGPNGGGPSRAPCSITPNIIDDYIKKTAAWNSTGTVQFQHKPLEGYGTSIMEIAQNFNVSAAALVGISFVESKWGAEPAAQATNNAFGIMINNALVNFPSWNASIAAAANTLNKHIAGDNPTQTPNDTIAKLYSGGAGAYCVGPGCAQKVGIISQHMKALGGDPDDLTGAPCEKDSQGNWVAKKN